MNTSDKEQIPESPEPGDAQSETGEAAASGPEGPKRTRKKRPRAQMGVVANIRERVQSAEGEPVEEGHRHFAVGAKVHVLPPEWSYRTGGELRVIGRQKDTGRLACMIVRRRYLTGWRIKSVHTPRILEMMEKALPGKLWTEKTAAKFVYLMESDESEFDA